MGEVLPFKKKETNTPAVEQKDAYEIFIEAAKRNKENKERLQKEHSKDNKKVLDEYGIYKK